LIAAPVPSTGAVATSPRWKKAIWPFANELAGATAAAVPVPVVALGEAEADAEAEAVLLAAAEAVGGWKWFRNACWLIVVECELDTAKTIPRVTPSATGMARGTAMRIARLRRLRRRDADLCMVSI
jgi:hypothetical protein